MRGEKEGMSLVKNGGKGENSNYHTEVGRNLAKEKQEEV